MHFILLSSPHEDDMDSSIHSHTAPPFLISPGDQKLFAPPGSFNFSMAALAADPAALAGMFWEIVILYTSLNKCDYLIFSTQKHAINYVIEEKDICNNNWYPLCPHETGFNSQALQAAELAGSPQGKSKLVIY